MASSKLSPEFPLPLELLYEIIKFLPPTDLQTLSLASRLTRSQAIHFIFGHLRYTGNVPPKVRKIHQARKDVKELIKKLELRSNYINVRNEDGHVIFQFLKSLPNLQVLDVGELVPSAYLSQFISSIRHTALLELVLETGVGRFYTPVEGPPTAGLAGLKKLSIGWSAGDNPNEPGSSLAHLYELIRPSLTTLVELELSIDNLIKQGNFDLQVLKPAADTLRTFEYTLLNADESILDTIPAILPHLTKLSIIWGARKHPVLWKDAHIQALSKNKNLTDLHLSSDFEVNAQDTVRAEAPDYAWFVRCYKRRLKVTQDIASAFPQLQRCSWFQRTVFSGSSATTHSFIVEERKTGSNVTRVVRGVKQHWMGRDHISQGSIVKCKLEDLLGDIVEPTEDSSL